MQRFILCLVLLLWQWKASAQNYLLRYVTTANGAITFVGNTMGLAKQFGQNNAGTVDSIGAFTTRNTNFQAGNFPPGTTFNWTNNSSEAILRLPTNSTVLYAELIWAGSAQIGVDTSAAGDVMPYVDNQVRLVAQNNITNFISPDPVTAAFTTNPAVNINQRAIFYVRSADVTAIVKAAGSGTYSVKGVPGTLFAAEDNNNVCGWTLAVVYQNSLLHQRNLSLFVGNSIAIANTPPPKPASVSGFCSPPTGAVNARLFVSAMEGDPNKTGDQMLFGTSTNNLQAVSGPNNPLFNFFGGQINDDNGVLDTSGTFGFSNSTPSSFSVAYSARQGWDITSVDASATLTNGVTSAYAQNITSNDGYTVNALGLQIDVGSPVLSSVQSVDKASTFVSDVLTYTVTITNSGTADAINLVFNDPLAFGTSFITNSFATNGVPILGANPVTGVFIPLIQQSNTMVISYKVSVDQIPPDAKFITASTINFQSTGPCAQSPVINSTIVNLDVQTLAPLLELTKSSTLTNVVPGGIMTYTISIPNMGTTNDYNCQLFDPLPVGLTYIPNTTRLNGATVTDNAGGGFPYAAKKEIHGFGRPAGQINSGDTATITFQVQISLTPPDFIDNVATFYDDGPPQDVSSVIPPIYADLAVGITANPTPVPAGSPLSYTVSVTNLGPNSATTLFNFVTLSLPLSPYLLSPTYSPSVGVYNPSNGVWSGINLPSNAVVTMTISGVVSPSIVTSNINASVTVTPALGVIDPFKANNTATNSDPVFKVADLAVTISDGVDFVQPGDLLTYYITAINLGPSTLDSITLSNTVSPFLQNVSLFPTVGTYNVFNGVWNGLNLAAGGSVTMILQGTVPTNAYGASFSNSVVVSVPSGVIDPVLTNNFAIDYDNVVVTPVVNIFKTGPTNVFAGTNFIYTITITNSGTGSLSNVVVSDSLPAGESFVSASGSGTPNFSGGVFTWSLPFLAPGTAANFALTVTAPAAGNLLVTNVAILTGTGPGTNTMTNASPPVITTIMPLADISVSKTGPSVVTAGTNFNYSITVSNAGPSAASSVTATDALPAGLTFVSATSGGATNTFGQVIWNGLGTIAANTATNLILTVHVPGNVTGLTNVAGAGSPIPDPLPPNNTNPPVITIVTAVADVSVSKTGPSTVTAGTNFSYSITVSNAGPSAASSVTATDALPAGLKFVSATSGGVTNTFGQVIWNGLGTIAANTATNLILTVQVAGNVTGLTNVAGAGSPIPDPLPPNNTNPPVITIVTPLADISVSKTGPSVVTAGTNFNYSITVSNAGPSAATSVTATDALPAGLTFVSATSGGATNTFGQVIWNGLGTIAANTSTNLILTVHVPGNVTGLTNVAGAGSPIPDPLPPNNTNPPVITIVTPLADISVSKTGPSTVTAGTNFSYSITVSNAGPSAASSVTATDALPAGLTFVSATSGGATNTFGQVIWNGLGTIAANTATNLILTVHVPGNVTGLTNVAGAGSPIPDPLPPNNTNPPVITIVTPLADISVSKTGPSVVTAGTNFNYSITVSNAGPSAATSVTATDALPAGLTFVSATSGCATNTFGQVIWNGLGTIAANTATNLILTVQVAGNVTGLTNVAGAGSPIPDPLPPNNTNPPVITIVTPLADISVSKTGPSTVTAGTNFSYSITVSNAGPSAATSVTATDALPAGLTFVSATSGGATNTFGQVIWNGLGTIAANTATNLILTVHVPGNITGLTNVAGAGSPIPDPLPPNNTNPPVITIVTPLADISVSKTGPSTITAGTNFSYSITVSNAGPSAASSVTATDALPAGLTFVSATSGGATNLVGQVIWNGLGTIAANTATNLILTVQVAGNITGLTNVAGAGSPIPDPLPPNNTNPPVITIVTTVADLALTKTAPANVLAGANFNYNLAVTNFGPSTAGSVTVTDALPAGLIFVSATGGGGTNNAGQVVWPNLGNISANASTNLTLTVQVLGNAGTLTNIAAVYSPTPDPLPPNNTNPPAITTVTPQADLGITKTAQTNVVAGGTLNYSITVTNAGPSDASSVTVTDALPAGVIFVSATSGGATNFAGQAVWSGLGTIAANTSTNLTLTVQVLGNAGNLTNVASVFSPIPDPFPPNNTNPPAITTVIPQADLSLTKTAQTNVLAGASFSYSLTVSNAGPSAATNVSVTDPLPAGVIFVSATSGGATNFAGQAVWSGLGTLAANAITNLTLTVQVLGNAGTLTNVASVLSPTPDPLPPNNTNPPAITTVTPQADLGITKTAQTNVVAGGTLSYSITVTNAGPSDASSVTVTDALPAGVIFVSATSGGATNFSGQAVWSGLGTIAANTSTNLTLTVQVLGNAGNLTNVASVFSPIPDPFPPNNTNPPAITTVTPQADLSLTKTAQTNVLAGASFSYSLTVSNAGPSAATNVSVTDPLPAGTLFVSATSGGATNNFGQAVWSGLGTIAANATTNLTLTVQVLGNAGTLTNVASVLSPTPDPLPPNNTNPPAITTVTPQADLGITKTAQTNVVAGGTLIYSITVTNAGPSDASSVTVTDALPAGVIFVSATSGGATNFAGQAVWSGLGTLAANTSTNLTLTVQVLGSAANLTNVASVFSPIPDPFPPNNTNPPAITTVTPQADLSLTKTAQTNVLAGASFSYSLTVSNAGPSAATNVSVTDPLPAGTLFVSATSGGATNFAGQAVWSGLGTIAANATTNLTLTVQVLGNAGTLTNVASVLSPTPDPLPPNNTNPPAITTVTPQADLGITKTAQTNVVAGGTLNYSITVTNAGPSDASSVTVTDALPAGVIFVSATSGGATNFSGQAVWSGLGTIAANTSTNLTLTVQVLGNAGNLTNVASVFSPIPDPFPPNNTNPPAITTVTPQADLSLTKTAQTNVLAGASFSYSLTVSNAGPSAATNVSVTDPLPAGVIFVSATSGGATNFAGQAVWSGLGTLAANTTTNLTLTVQVLGNAGILTNVASVLSPTPDPLPPNNTNPPAITTVTPQADLGITKTAQTNVVAGGTLNYSITVTNAGPSDASSVTVTDALPAGVIFVSATSGGATNFAGHAVWSGLGTIAANTSTNLTLTVQVLGNAGNLTNVASVFSPIPDPFPPNNTNPPAITTVTPQADLSLTKTAQTNVLAGASFSYSLTVSNAGPSAATNVSVTDPLPAGVIFVSATSGGATNFAGQAVWSGLGTLAANAITNLTLTVQVLGNAGTLTNVASVLSPTPDPLPPNNTNPPAITTVTPQADLGITKTAQTNVVAGGTLNYSITVTNAGPSAASSVTVTDALPAGVIFVSATSGGATNFAGQAVWSGLGTIAANTSTNLTLTVQVLGNAGNLTNVASVFSPIPDPFPPNNTNPPAITTVTPQADLSLTKTAQTNVLAGASFSYSLTVSNAGPSAATNVSVTDPLPAGVIFVSATSGGATNFAGQAVWSGLGTLAANAITNLTLTVQVLGNAGTLTNVASVLSPTPDPLPPNNTNPPSITTVTPVADVIVFLSGPSTGMVGSNLVYSIVVSNAGPSTASNVVTLDLLPAGATYVSSSGGGSVSNNVVYWPPFNSLPVGGTISYTLTVSPQSAGVITNVAAAGSTTFDPNLANNNGTSTASQTQTTVSQLAADIAVFKSGPTTGVAGSNLVYTVTVTNLGPSTATNVVVYDQLPAGFAFVSSVPGAASISGNLINWAGFTLVAGARTNFTVTAVSAEGGAFTNIAYAVSSTPDPNPSNNNGTQTNSQVTTIVSSLADVAVFKTGATNSVIPGTLVTYTLVATNYGPSTASNVVVKDLLPAGAVSVSGSGGFTTSNNVVSWAPVTLSKGASVTYSLSLTLSTSGTVTNFGLSTSTTPDPSTNNNNGSTPPSQVVTMVRPAADVFVLLAGPTNVLVSTNFTYTISVTNMGSAVASNVVVGDTLPAAVVFVSATGGGGLTNGIYTWPSIGLLPVGTGTNFTITVYATSVTTFTNVAYSTATSYDPNLANNNGTLPASQKVTAATQVHLVPVNLSLLVYTNNFNPQSSLYDELVVVTNLGTAPATAVRLTVAGLPSYVTLYNASGTNAGVPYVQSNFPLAPGATVDFVLEFYDSLRKPFTNIVSAYEVQPDAQPVIPTNLPVHITSIFQSHINLYGNAVFTNTSRFVIEFATTPGHTYTILYSDTLNPTNWFVVFPYINANATAVQWFDDGPPKTKSPPSSVNSRFYRVIQVK